jgi:hypothetical protein
MLHIWILDSTGYFGEYLRFYGRHIRGGDWHQMDQGRYSETRFPLRRLLDVLVSKCAKVLVPSSFVSTSSSIRVSQFSVSSPSG